MGFTGAPPIVMIISEQLPPVRGPNVKQRLRTRKLIQRCARGLFHAGYHANSPQSALCFIPLFSTPTPKERLEGSDVGEG